MRLRSKTVIALSLMTLLLVVGLYGFARDTLLRRSAAIDGYRAERDVERVLDALLDRQGALQSKVADWAFWDDTYTFAQDANEQFIEENFANDVYGKTVKADYALIFDNTGKLLFGKAYDFQSGKEEALPPVLADVAAFAVAKKPERSEAEPVSGLLALPDLPSPLMFARAPILRNTLEGPRRGDVVFASRLGSTYLDQLTRTLKMPVKLHSLEHMAKASEMSEVRDIFSSGASVATRVLDENTVAGYTVLRDARGRDCLLVESHTQRLVYLVAVRVLNALSLVFIVAGAVMGLIVLVLQNRFVLSRLADLGKTVNLIRRDADFSRRTHVKGNDELADLSSDINRMLDALEKAQQSVRESEGRLRSIVDTAVDGIITVDEQGRIESFNRGAEQIFGYSREDAVGQSLALLALDTDLEVSAPGTIVELAREMAGTVHEVTARKKDGTPVPLYASVSVADLGDRRLFTAILHDATDHKRAEAALRESEEQYRALLAAAPDLMIVLDSEGRYRSVYTAEPGLLIRPPEELIGKKITEFFPEDIAQSILSVIDATLSSGASQILEYFVDIGDKRLCFAARTARVVTGGTPQVLWVARDITVRKQAEEAVQHRAQMEELVATVSSRLLDLPSEELDRGIENSLGELGRFVGVDRAQVFLFRPDGHRLDNTHEWCGDGIEAHIEQLQGLTRDDFPWFYDAVVHRGLVRIDDVDALPEEAGSSSAPLKAHGIKSILAVPMIWRARSLGFIGFDAIRKKKRWNNEDLSLLRIVGEAFASAIQRRRAEQELRQKQEHIEEELGQAAEYVRSMLPHPLDGPVRTNWRFVASSTLGGDLLNYYWLNDHTFVFYLLDVSGHGVGAALLSTSVHNALRRYSLANVRFDRPDEVLSALNKAFPMELNDSKFFSIWYGVYDLTTRVLSYSVGGHPPAVLFTRGDRPPVILGPTDLLLGVQEDAEYAVREFLVHPESRLYLFSDGIYEIPKPDGGILRRCEFVDLLREVDPWSHDRLDAILGRLYEIKGTTEFDDDVSLLEVEFT